MYFEKKSHGHVQRPAFGELKNVKLGTHVVCIFKIVQPGEK